MAKNDIPRSVRCSFCGKAQENVRKIVAGPGVYICDECVDLCNSIIDAELYEEDPGYELAEHIPSPQEIKEGSASLFTVIDGENLESFEIQIEKLNLRDNTKNIVFKVTDEKLLNKTGGIVQGMSGSPIVQNNKIIGAVTHVIVNDCTRGYGIFITNMLEESEN